MVCYVGVLSFNGMCPRARSEWNACIFSGWDPRSSRCIVIDIIIVVIVSCIDRIRQRRLVTCSEITRKATVTCEADGTSIETLHSPGNGKTDLRSLRFYWNRQEQLRSLCESMARGSSGVVN